MARANKSGSFSFGLVLIIVGFLLLLDQMDLLDFGDVVSTYWPFILIAIGVKIILFPRERVRETRRRPVAATEQSEAFTPSNDDVTLQESRVFGDIRQQISSPEFKGGRCSVVFGDIDIKADSMGLGDGQRTLYLNGVFGDIRLSLPETIPFLIRANSAAGEIDLRGVRGEGIFIQRSFKTPDFETANTRLIVVVSVLFGDIKVW